MPNPIDFVTQRDIEELGLSPNEIKTSYQPSLGGVYHARGAEGTGKTLWIAHFYRYLIDSGKFTPGDAVGNISFKGKYGDGFTTLKGEILHKYLWDLTHKPYTHKIVIIDEIDSEFPARFFSSKEQTEIALRMWHVHKLDNFVLMTSHIGNSTDLIFHLASHYLVLPESPSFERNSMNFTLISNLELWTEDFTAHDIIKTMLLYNRRELTEDSEKEQSKTYAHKKKKAHNFAEDELFSELDVEQEL